jgi:hypothetical protein
MLKSLLAKNIPNTQWRSRSNNDNLNVCCTCRGDRFTAKVTEGLEGYSYQVRGNNITYRNKVNNLDDLITDISTIFNTLEND